MIVIDTEPNVKCTAKEIRKPDKLTTDQKLRERGYRIHSRPAKGEAVWVDQRGWKWRQSAIVEAK